MGYGAGVLVLVGLVTLCFSTALTGELCYNGPAGELNGLYIDGEELPVSVTLMVPLKGWRSIARQQSWSAKDIKLEAIGARRRWTGKLLAGNESFAFEQIEREEGSVLRLNFTVTSESDAALEGIYLSIDLPVAEFARGRCSFASSGGRLAEVELPAAKPAARHLASVGANEARISSADGARGIAVRFARELPLTLQDNREWNIETYSIMARFHDGNLAKGARASIEIALEAHGRPDRTDAVFNIDVQKKLGDFVGFGGNYCFGIESPVTEYTLTNLRVGCARVEMTLSEWEPENDNDSPTETNWQYLRAQVKPGSNLEREFLLAQRIQKMKIPYGISAWRMPKWLHPRAGEPLERAKYAEMVESVSSYLVHAKNAYGVEPDWFSFNEPDWGVDVKFSPEEHRDMIKLLGTRFTELGLKTKLLLADVTNPRGTHTYALPTLSDPEAMRFVNAIAFHSWGGASPEQYRAWKELAEKARLPLYVTEVGLDAFAWRNPAYIETFRYALSEARHYQELLAGAYPYGTMQWEFTSDYGLAHESRGRVEPTKRFWFMKHLCNLTPPGAKYVHISPAKPVSRKGTILTTAFIGARGELSIHILNCSASRRVSVRGLPRTIKTLNAVRTSAEEDYTRLAPLTVRAGVAEIELPRHSLTTLTSGMSQ